MPFRRRSSAVFTGSGSGISSATHEPPFPRLFWAQPGSESSNNAVIQRKRIETSERVDDGGSEDVVVDLRRTPQLTVQETLGLHRQRIPQVGAQSGCEAVDGDGGVALELRVTTVVTTIERDLAQHVEVERRAVRGGDVPTSRGKSRHRRLRAQPVDLVGVAVVLVDME